MTCAAFNVPNVEPLNLSNRLVVRILGMRKQEGSYTTRIDHTEVLPGSWKAGVPQGLVADGNSTLVFSVAGLGHPVHGLVIQTLCGEQQRMTQRAGVEEETQNTLWL